MWRVVIHYTKLIIFTVNYHQYIRSNIVMWGIVRFVSIWTFISSTFYIFYWCVIKVVPGWKCMELADKNPSPVAKIICNAVNVNCPQVDC